MKNFIGVLTLALFFVPAFGGEPPQQAKSTDLTWAFPVADKDIPPGYPDGAVRHLPRSTKTYTQGEIDDLFNPPDWFPENHAPMPHVIARGSGAVAPGCASCHLASGIGHPESANLTGLTASYMERQLNDFKSGVRTDARKRMSSFAQVLSDEDIKQAAEWFASLKPFPRDKVVEAETVPKSYVTGTRRYAWPGGGTEPLGHRIIELPEDQLRVAIRDPLGGFIDYVPVGSIARGEELVTSGGAGKTIACAICHGPSLAGLGEVPRIAGHDPIYIVRQLYGFQNGARNSTMAELMKAVVARLDGDDIIAIAAYVGSRTPPTTESASTPPPE
jgi:cytochrome c553